MPRREILLLVSNESSETNITIYVYHRWDPLCFISQFSKIIEPNEKYLFRESNSFQYQIFAGKKEFQATSLCDADRFVQVFDNRVVGDRLENHQLEKRVAVQYDDFKKNFTNNGGEAKDLYSILGLNEKVQRKKPLEEQDRDIRRAYHNQIRRYHPDRNPDGGNAHITREVIVAHEILKDRKLRTRYHNQFDYDKHKWWDPRRYWSVFRPEVYAHGNVERENDWKRITMTLTSVVAAAGGIGLVAVTGGMAAVPMIVGSVAGFGLINGGLLSLNRSLRYECKLEDWGKTFGIGAAAGALTGSIAGGITCGIAGAGTTISTLSTGKQILLGSSISTVGGALNSVAVDVDRMAIDGEHLTTKQIVGHAFCGAATGAALGAAGGAIGAKFNAIGSSTNADEIAVTITGRRLGEKAIQRMGKKAIQSITTRVVEGAISNTSDSLTTVIEERFDNEAENKRLIEHGKTFGGGLVGGILKNVAFGFVLAEETHPEKKIKVGDHHKMQFSTFKADTNLVNVVDDGNWVSVVNDDDGDDDDDDRDGE